MRSAPIILLLACSLSGPLQATAGFAEWEVFTPGGHLISHNDIWKADHGTCLRSDTQQDAGDAEIYVSHLARWRYYEDHIAGQDAGGHFLFSERDGELLRLASETALLAAVESLAPLSSWLGPADGWQEAWFPFMTWRPCKILLDDDVERVTAGMPDGDLDRLREAATRMYTPTECRSALDPSRLELYRVTTWGRLCRRWSEHARPLGDGRQYLEVFCEDVLP